MSDETEKLYARIAAQAQEIINLRGGYLIVQGQLQNAMRLLVARRTGDAAATKRAAIAAETAATEVETAASVASELVLKATREAKSLSPPAAAAAAAAAAVKLVAAEARVKVAEIVKAELRRADGEMAGFAALETKHAAASTLLNAATELAASIARDSLKLQNSLKEYSTP
jgi:hypothetical protein